MGDTGTVYERRNSARKIAALPVKLKNITAAFSAQINSSFSKDLSETGMQVCSFNFYPVNSKIFLETMSAEATEPVRIMGQVVWIEQLPYQERYKVGIKFVEVSDETKFKLKEIVSSLPVFKKINEKSAEFFMSDYYN